MNIKSSPQSPVFLVLRLFALYPKEKLQKISLQLGIRLLGAKFGNFVQLSSVLLILRNCCVPPR